MTGLATNPEAAVRWLRDLHQGPHRLDEVIALGGAAVPALEALARDPPASIADHRRLAVRALRSIGSRAANLALRRVLADSMSRELDPVQRQAEDLVAGDAASALGALGARDAADLLLGALAIRPIAGCVEALGALGDARAVPFLVRCLADATARAPARDTLVRFGSVAVTALVGALSPPVAGDEHEGANSVLARAVAAEVLDDIGGTEALEGLSRALRDPQQRVRVAAALALARRGRLGAAGIPALAEALAGDRWDVAEEAAAALAAMGGEAALRASAEVARMGAARAVRERAIRALARWPGLAAASALAGLLDDPDPYVRDALVVALAGRPEGVAREALEVLARDPDREARRRATAALGRGSGGVLRGVRSFLVGCASLVRRRHVRAGKPGGLR